LEAGWGARAREGGEYKLSRRGEARRLASPERGACGEGEELRELDEQAVDDLDRFLRVVDGDVDVEAEDQLPPGDVLHLVDQLAVAVARGNPLALEEAERMCAGGPHAHAAVVGDRGDVGAQRPELVLDVGRRAADRSRDLDDGLHQLGVDARLELMARRGREDGLDMLDEV